MTVSPDAGTSCLTVTLVAVDDGGLRTRRPVSLNRTEGGPTLEAALNSSAVNRGSPARLDVAAAAPDGAVTEVMVTTDENETIVTQSCTGSRCQRTVSFTPARSSGTGADTGPDRTP